MLRHLFRLRQRLDDVLMFDDFALVIEAEDVHHRLALVIRRGLAEHMRHHQIPFGNHALHFRPRLRMFFQERGEGSDKRRAAIGHGQIVLNVGFGDV